MKNLSITPGTNNVGAYINDVDLKNLDQYKEEAAKVLWRYSPENPLVKERYRKLFA